jgi:hypothetical protein
MSEQSQPVLPDEALVPGALDSGSRVQRALRNYYAHKFSNLFLAFFFQIFVAKTLKPEHYATYAIFLAILIASERLFSFGVDRTMLRFVPSLTSHGDFAGLRWLAIRLGSIRIGSLVTVLLAIYVGSSLIRDMLPMPVSTLTLIAFGAWFASYALLADADALAQSWVAHTDTASLGTFEIVARNVIIIALFFCDFEMTGSTIIEVSALTSSVAATAIARRFLGFGDRIRELGMDGKHSKYPLVDVRQAPMFAAAAYASTMGWLISSPAVVRIFAKSGLDLIAFAAFSFIQGLCVSVQRGFPGMLILPSLEPILVRFGSGAERSKMFSVLSLIFKVELILILSIITVTSIAGSEIISLLSRPAYAPYYYVLPVMMLILLLQTIYRICETVMSVGFQHRAFLALWPLSLFSITALYFTVEIWGLWSIIGIPIVESSLRVGFLLFAYRRTEIWRALDPLRSLYLILTAALVILSVFAYRLYLSNTGSSWLEAIAGLAVFVGALFILRPLRKPEVEYVSSALPISFPIARRIVACLSRH